MSDISREHEGVDATSAAAALSEVGRVERRAREAFTYGDCAAVYYVWGAVTTIGYLNDCFYPNGTDGVWTVLNVVGLAATVALGLRGAIGRRDTRPVWVTTAISLFSHVWFYLLLNDATTPRDAATFFPTTFMLGLVVMGLWLGRLISLTGMVVTALVLVVNAFAPDGWFNPLMALCVGGGLIAAGWLMRRVGMNDWVRSGTPDRGT